ncbi:MAG: hypothetical protein GY714_05550 [Desulfobacterales bacterium]|nr:hypothetical protein [Desulfobacterales bacterium]
MEVLGIAITLLGFAIAIGIFFIQRQRGKLTINTFVSEDDVTPNKNRNVTYQNNEANISVNVRIEVINNHILPITINSYVISILRKLPKRTPKMMVNFLKPVMRIPIKDLGQKLPITIPSNEKAEDINLCGRNIAYLLDEKGKIGNLNVRFEVIDDKNNVYQTDTINIAVDKWLNERGKFIFATG